jgi:hypothetical protein
MKEFATLSPAELYTLSGERVENNPEILIGYYWNHLKYNDSDDCISEQTKFINSHRLEIRVLRDIDYLHFSWRLATVFIDKEPVMIIQNYGDRYEHGKRFITDAYRFSKLVMHVKSLILHENEIVIPVQDIIDEHKKNPEITQFCDHDLFSYFSPSTI